MSRQKKTKQRKIIADLRRKIDTAATLSPQVTASKEAQTRVFSFTSAPSRSITTPDSHTYLGTDIKKTSLLTLILLAAQLLLYYLLHTKIISIGTITF
jgi:hypothetical protein